MANPEIFGGYFWGFGHMMTYLHNNVFGYMILTYLLHDVPCGVCNENTKNYICKNPIDRKDPYLWFHNFHNYKNGLLGKRKFTLKQSINRTRKMLKSKDIWESYLWVVLKFKIGCGKVDDCLYKFIEMLPKAVPGILNRHRYRRMFAKHNIRNMSAEKWLEIQTKKL